jgi:hypothetical protein
VIRHLSTWLLLGLTGAGLLVCGCGGAGSTTSTVLLGSSGAPATVSAPAAAATGAAGSAGSARSAGSAAGASAPGNSAPAQGRQSTPAASGTTTAAAPGSLWNAVQCGVGLRALIKSKGATSPAQLRAYKQTLRSQHGCFAAASHAPTPPKVAGVKAWSAVQCAAAVAAYAESGKLTVSALRAYKRTLQEHGCFTAASLSPSTVPAKPKQHG